MGSVVKELSKGSNQVICVDRGQVLNRVNEYEYKMEQYLLQYFEDKFIKTHDSASGYALKFVKEKIAWINEHPDEVMFNPDLEKNIHHIEGFGEKIKEYGAPYCLLLKVAKGDDGKPKLLTTRPLDKTPEDAVCACNTCRTHVLAGNMKQCPGTLFFSKQRFLLDAEKNPALLESLATFEKKISFNNTYTKDKQAA